MQPPKHISTLQASWKLVWIQVFMILLYEVVQIQTFHHCLISIKNKTGLTVLPSTTENSPLSQALR